MGSLPSSDFSMAGQTLLESVFVFIDSGVLFAFIIGLEYLIGKFGNFLL